MTDPAPSRESVATFCRTCNKACPVIADVEDGRLVAIHGDRSNSLYAGYSCAKGRSAANFANHPDRILHSQKRDEAGAFVSISVERAMDEIADRLASIIAEHGPRSVAVYSGTQLNNVPAGPLISSLLAEIGSPMRFEAFTIDKPGRAIAWAMLGRWQAPHQGFHEPDVVMMLGINPFVNGIGGLPLGHPGRWLSQRMAAGMRLIVIDPRRTDVAKRATIHLAPRPGFDIHIVAAMLRVIIDEQLWDHRFVDDNVEGLDRLRAAVESFDPDLVARLADVDREQIVAAARLFATAGRGYAVAGTGPHMSGPGTLLEYLVLSLDTLCGHWMRAGETVANPGVLVAPKQFVAQATAPVAAYGTGPKTRIRGLGMTTAGMPTSTLAEEILSPGSGQVRALISIGGNPVAAFPDDLLTVEALRSLDLMVQVDPWMSQSARLAHYVIAPTQWMEMAGSTQKLEGVQRVYSVGYAFPTNYAQYSPAIVAPPHGSEIIEDWQFIYGVAKRLGVQLSVANQIGERTEIDMTTMPTSDHLIELITAGSNVPLAEVRIHPHGAVFPLAEPAIVQPKQAGWADRLDVANLDMLVDLGGIAASIDLDEPVYAQYPYRLLCRRMPHVVNSSFNDRATNHGRGYNPAFMNPADLESLGLGPGDEVRLASSRAEVPAIVEPDRDVRRGTISMSFGFGGLPDETADVRTVGSSVSRLIAIDADFERYSGQPRMSNVPVRVTPC